jgi:hypothetical protein
MPAIDPSAVKVLKNACAYLASCQRFSFRAEEWKDVVLPSGRKVQTTKTVEVQLSRPDKLHVEVRSAKRSMGYWQKDKVLTVLDRVKGFYGTVETPPNLDEALDFVLDRFGMEVPLEDLLRSDPFAGVMEGVESGEDLGRVTVLGVPCRHLAFVGAQADWQVWIEEGARPVVKKLVIDYRDRPGSPQYTAILSGWDMVTPIAEGAFEFDNVDGATRVEVLPVPAASSGEPAGK